MQKNTGMNESFIPVFFELTPHFYVTDGYKKWKSAHRIPPSYRSEHQS